MHSSSSFQNARNNDSLQPFKMNLNFKVEVYPDLYSHIKSTRLEYPKSQLATRNDDISSILGSSKFTNNNTTSHQSSNSSNKKQRRLRNPSRYVTQPITLIEIKELEEENHHNHTTNHSNDRNANKTDTGSNDIVSSHKINEKITLV